MGEKKLAIAGEQLESHWCPCDRIDMVLVDYLEAAVFRVVEVMSAFFSDDL